MSQDTHAPQQHPEVPETHAVINPYSWAQAGFSAAWLLAANHLYQWQIGSIKNDKYNHPDRVYESGSENYEDMEWALGTFEKRAWYKASWSIIDVYAPQLILWTLNHYFDNEGGLIHRYYWRYTQAMQVLSFLPVWYFNQIESAYAQYDWLNYYEETDSTPFYTMPFYYDPEELTYGNWESMDLIQNKRIGQFKTLTVVGVLMQYFIYKGIREEYFAACDRNALAELEAEGEAGEAEEPVDEFDEEVFFLRSERE